MNFFTKTRISITLAVALALLVAGSAAVEAGVNTWTSAGPEGGHMTVLVADPRTVDVVYAGTFGRGLFKTSSGARVWARLPLASVVTVLAVDPVNPAILYADGGDGLSKSTNGGVSFAPARAGLPSFVTALAVDRTVPSTVYAGAGCCGSATGVFKSTDGGATWSPSLATETIGTIAIDPQTPTTVYAGTGGGASFGVGIFKSTNAGATWSPANSGLTRTNIRVIAIDPQTPSILYAGTNPGGVFKSTNGGSSWSPVNVGLGFIDALTVFTLVIDPQTPTTLYAGTNGSVGVFKSTNGGASWSPSSAGLPTAFPASLVQALAMNAGSPATLYAATIGGGVFKTTNGGLQWTAVNASLRASPIGRQRAGQPLVIDPSTPTILYASTDGNGVFKSTSGGASWLPANTGLLAVNMTLAIAPSTPATLYAGTPNNDLGVFRSTNAGGLWTPTSLTSVFVSALAVDPLTPATVYAGTEAGVFKTTNGGSSWSPLPAGPSNCVSALAIDPKTPATIYAGTGCFTNNPGGGIFKSTNGGTTWSPSSTGIPAVSQTIVAALAIDPQTPSTLYASTGGNVFKSTNGGATWTPSGTGLSGGPIVLAIVPEATQTLYAGTQIGGVFRSTNGGGSWSPINAGLPNLEISAVVVDPTGACLHAGNDIGVFDFATQASSSCPPPPPLVSAVLPTSRSVQVDTGATAFATIINASAPSPGTTAAPGDSNVSVTGLTCGITQLTGAPTPFTFQATDPATNQPVGTPNTPVDIAPGAGSTFVISLTPIDVFCPVDVSFGFNCTNSDLANIVVGLNTLLLTASGGPVPDIIALAATPTADGYVTLPGPGGSNVFAMATSNVGVSGSITVTADTGGATLPVTVTLCQTNPATGACLSPPAPTVTLSIAASATPTFAAFVSASGPVPDDPATNRIFVRFKDATPTTCGGVSQAITRGSTSVAVRTQ